MGSLGSKTINDKITDYMSAFRSKDYEVLYVTGEAYYKQISKMHFPDNVKVVPFIPEMSRIMKRADLMVSRAGASTMSEIMTLNIPTIFIPSPYVTNNHQYKNAMDLVKKDAALILKEEDLNKNDFIRTIDNILTDEERYNTIKNNLKTMGITDSSSRIYEILKDMIMDDKKFY